MRFFSLSHLSLKTIAVKALLLLVGGSLGLAAFLLLNPRPMSAEAAYKGVVSCESEDNEIQCTRPFIKEWLKVESPAKIMETLGARLKPAQCHYVGHVVGQQTFIAYKNMERSIAWCGRGCDSACMHGAIGEAFAQTLGMGSADDPEDIDLKHLSVQEIEQIGKRLCVSAEACHGVGHSVFQATGDIQKAMNLCKGMNNFVSSCYNGAAMEYADILASRNMRDTPGVTHPDLAKLSQWCTVLPDIIQARSCFRYYPRMVIETVKAEGKTEEDGEKRIRELCSGYTDVLERTACYSGIGSHNAYFILTDQPAAVKVCTDIPGKRNQAACFFGEIAVAVEERQDKLLHFCTLLPEDDFKLSCYQHIFYYLKRFGVPANKEKICADNILCARGYEARDANPWTHIQETFGASKP